MYASFLKKLNIFGVLYGARAKKIAGIQDKNNLVSDTIVYNSDNTITLTMPVPEFLKARTYFRIKNSSGPNSNALFRVLEVNGNTIILDPSTVAIPDGPVIATLDARLAVVHNNPLISMLNTEGNTIFNSSNGSLTTGLDDGSQLGIVMAEHYHADSISPDNTYVETFTLGDWFSSDGGLTYSLDIAHGLNSAYPDSKVYESPALEEVWLHRTKVLDSNSLRISVSNKGADARFSGTIRVSK